MTGREKKMQNVRLVRIGLRFTALTLALGAGGYLLRSRPTPIAPLKIAAPVISAQSTSVVADDWEHLQKAQVKPVTFPGFSVRSTDTYDWLPDGRALLVRYAGGQNCVHKLYAASPENVTPLQNFNRKYSRKLYAYFYSGIHAEEEHIAPEITPPYCTLSPDGKHLLWLEDNYPHTNLEGMYSEPQIMAAAAVDGSAFREWEYTKIFPHWIDAYDSAVYNEIEAHWLRGNRWIMPYINGYAIIRADRPHSWRVIRFSKSDLAQIEPGVIGEARDGFILTGKGAEYYLTNSATLTRFRPDTRRLAIESAHVLLPLHGQVGPIRLSPKGDKLAWVIQGNSKTALWISSATGKFAGLSAPVELPATSKPGSLRWLPDGRHLSFLSGETLYKVTLP